MCEAVVMRVLTEIKCDIICFSQNAIIVKWAD